MEYVFCCPKCGATYSLPSPDAVKICSDCRLQTVYTGYSEEAWAKLSPKERMVIKKSNGKTLEQLAREKEEKRQEAIRAEEEKQIFAKSFNDFYEYDVVTVFNENHGRVNRERMMAILSEHARAGWKLHTIYSNELGRNEHSAFGYGTNSTACEDVLIFERRVEKLP